MLTPNSAGHYRFLEGIDPYSCGVVADPGHEIVRVPLRAWMPWRQGFEFVDRFLARAGVGRASLCAMELRSPRPFSMEGFIDYNRGYCGVLEEWGLLPGGINPVARTNVAPLQGPPPGVSLHAFSFVRPSATPDGPTGFIVAGAGELREGTLEPERIVRRGEISREAMLEKAGYVLEVMQQRLDALGVGWGEATAVNVYTVHPLEESLRQLLLDRIGPATRHGLCWHVTRPPVTEIEFEMDVHGPAVQLLG
ncbi:MAG TPA: hypothetical protein DCM86_17165 [Verrucomicrobiales bacterium]|nr:hypothetical protein [Verrucomicrobiales bacterium]